MERFVLQKYTFRFGLAIRFVLRIIVTTPRALNTLLIVGIVML